MTSTNPVLFKLALSSVALDFIFYRGFVLIERKRSKLLFFLYSSDNIQTPMRKNISGNNDSPFIAVYKLRTEREYRAWR
jgi:hypothetical protein